MMTVDDLLSHINGDHKNEKRKKRPRKKKNKNQSSSALETELKGTSCDDTSRECCICLDSINDCVFQCGHQTCKNCAT